jgi:hypothetical protein
LPPLAYCLGINKIYLSLFYACACLLKVGFGLFGSGLGPGDTRALFAVVEECQDCALAYAITDVCSKINEHSGNPESNFGCDASLHRSEAEDLNRNIALNLQNLHLDWAEKKNPRYSTGDRDGYEQYDGPENPSTIHDLPPTARIRNILISFAFGDGRTDLHSRRWNINHHSPLRAE